jgi:hypothetical protein
MLGVPRQDLPILSFSALQEYAGLEIHPVYRTS